MAEAQESLAELPEELRGKLRRARHVYKRGQRARIGSNEREACMEEFQTYVREAADEAAALGIAVDRLPEWAIEAFKEDPSTA